MPTTVSYMSIVLLIQISMYGCLRQKCHLPWIIVVIKDATSSVSIIIAMIIVIYPYSARGSGNFRNLIETAPVEYLVTVIRDFHDTRCGIPSFI